MNDKTRQEIIEELKDAFGEDIDIADNAEIEEVTDGYWVSARIWVYK